MSTDKILNIYTDGAALGNPGKGGYGIVMKWGNSRKEISQGFKHSTNNRMELMAVIVALESIKKYDIKIQMFTDSQYVCNAIEKKWVFNWQKTGWKNKKNVDLWLRFMPLYKLHNIKFHWVKGHAGNVENEVCDRLASNAAKLGPWIIDHGYETGGNIQTLL